MQAYELGQFFSRRYEKLLGDGSYSPDKVYTQSSEMERTIMSAAMVLAGLFPPKNIQIWNKDLLWQPIPGFYFDPQLKICLIRIENIVSFQCIPFRKTLTIFLYMENKLYAKDIKKHSRSTKNHPK